MRTNTRVLFYSICNIDYTYNLMEASDFMGMSPRTPGGKKLQLLSTATSSFQTYDLSEFNVVGKKAEDFFVRISGFTSSPAEKQSRSFTNLEITGFSNSVLTLKGTYTQYDYHANSLSLTVEIYVYK